MIAVSLFEKSKQKVKTLLDIEERDAKEDDDKREREGFVQDWTIGIYSFGGL